VLLKLINDRVTPYSLVPNRTRSACSPMHRPGRCFKQNKGTQVMWLATIYSLNALSDYTPLYQWRFELTSSTLVASIKRSDILKYIRTDIRTG
jgi:hypothetical protein